MNDIDLYLEVIQGHANHCGVNSSKTTGAKDFKFGSYAALCGECPAGAQIISPKVGVA